MAGVRPSPGAASREFSTSIEKLGARCSMRVAVPGDGRTPFMFDNSERKLHNPLLKLSAPASVVTEEAIDSLQSL